MDVTEHIKSRPSLYFGSKGPSAEAISQQIVFGANLLGVEETVVSQVGLWTLIYGSADWRYKGIFPKKGEGLIWDRPWAFPEAGPNTSRFEVMVKIFSERAFFWSPEETTSIVGEALSNEELEAFGLPSVNSRLCIGFVFCG